MTGIGMFWLQLGRHDALVRAEEVRIDVAAEVFDRAGGSVERNEVSEDPADWTETEVRGEVIHHITGVLHQLHRVLCTYLHHPVMWTILKSDNNNNN